MTVEQIKHTAIQLLIRWVFVLIPTVVIGYITLVFVNFSYTAQTSSIITQTVFFAVGLTVAYSVYFFRVRLIITVIILWLLYYVISKAIVKLPGEFDVFYANARFELYTAIFLFGWTFGFLLARFKYAVMAVVAVLAVATIISVSGTIDVSISYVLLHLAPVFVYGLYMLFLSPLLASSVEMDLRKSGRLFLRFCAFLLIAIFAFVLVQNLLTGNLKAVEKELAARGAKNDKNDGKDQNKKDKKDKGYDQRYGLMDKPGNGDDGYRLKDTMKINSKMSQSDVLMFCSQLNSFFPDGSPRPYYFVYHYLTRYDAAKETFTRDINIPFFDEMDADPSTLEMYHFMEDQSVITNSLATIARKVIDAKVYLSSNTWKHSLLAPGGAFYVQSIPVEKDFQKTYYSAYKVRSFASELNDAFLVYNPSASPMLEPYQKQRQQELTHVKSYQGIDKQFYNYYTTLPNSSLYDSIRALSLEITKGYQLPVDKVIAIRDYFLKRDEHGKRIYRYTLKPGGVEDKNIPSASMLRNFIFNTHAGYCTYYAGASLFMLRSIGIPSRFTTGFVAVNRNDKNKGWYWFYASQAHAWTQVYFPGYGWLDFDMTIGNEDQHEAPKPDGTPPLPPPEPWLVLNTKTQAPDVRTKKLDVTFDQLIYFDQGYLLQQPVTRTVDASKSRILYNKKDTTFACIQAGDSLIVVSFKDEVKTIPQPREGVSIDVQVSGFPKPIIADEIHIKPRPQKAKKDVGNKNQKKTAEKVMTWQEMLWLAGKIIAGIIVIVWLLPLLYLLYMLIRRSFAKNPLTRAEATYRAALYQFHMAGVERGAETPLEYARLSVDPAFGTSFEKFMSVYLRLKYSESSAAPDDGQVIGSFAKSYGSAINRKKGALNTAASYLNILQALRFFTASENTDDINQTTLL